MTYSKQRNPAARNRIGDTVHPTIMQRDRDWVEIWIFKQNRIEALSTCVKASQTFMLMPVSQQRSSASSKPLTGKRSASTIYITLHGIATFYNEPIGEARLPERKLHAGCVIVAKIVMIIWLVGIIAAAVVVEKTDRSIGDPIEDRLYVLDLVVASLALLESY